MALIFPHQNYQDEVSARCAGLPSGSRLSSGVHICAQAARMIATEALHLADNNVTSTLLGISQPSLAATVLALLVLRDPGRRLARLDLELLGATAEHVADFYLRWGMDPAFIQTVTEMRKRVELVYRRYEGVVSATAPGSEQHSLTSASDVTGGGVASSVLPGPASRTAWRANGSVDPESGRGYSAGDDNEQQQQHGLDLGLLSHPDGFKMDDLAAELLGQVQIDDFWNLMEADFAVPDAGGTSTLPGLPAEY